MGVELIQFEKDLKRIENLQFAFAYAKDNDEKLRDQLEKASTDPKNSYFGVTFEEFTKDLVEGFQLAEIVLLRRAVEHYTSAIHRGNDWRRQSDIMERCPTFRIKYNLNYLDVHVIDLSYDLRNIIIHPLGTEKFRFIEIKDVPPIAILQQEATIWTSRETKKKILILRGDDSTDDYTTRWHKMPTNFNHTRSDLFSGILFNEVRDCVRTYDSVREMSLREAIESSGSEHPLIEYL
ncbi:MAG TPA: hypothetical protein VMW71_00020 [Thermoplasmata archaeon]|nr:hypothetical protein [Thermoplasmata archaeon]